MTATITATRFQTPRHEVGYVYENDCGAIVAERVLLNRTSGWWGWRVRLFTGPDEWGAYYGIGDAAEAERMCLDHASQF